MKGLLFTYALTYGGALVSLFNPFYGLLIYFCFAIISPQSLWHWSVPEGNYSRIVAIALLIGWAGHGFGNWRFRGAKPIVFALLGYLAWTVLSAAFASDQAVAWNAIEAKLKIVLPFLVGITIIESIAQLKQLAWVLMLSQAYVAFDLNQSYFQGFNRLVEAGFGGMDNNCVSIAMVAGAGLAFFLGLGEVIWWRKLLAFTAAGLMAHVPMFGMSRGGMLGLIVTGIVAFLIIPKQPKHYLVFAFAVIVALRLAGPEVIGRFSSTFADAEQRDGSAQSRIDMWQNCWDVMKKNPGFGVGPDHWPLIAETYGWKRGKEAHSVWFQTGAELGFPGLGFLVAFYGMTVWTSWKLTRRHELEDPWFADSARMTVAALSGFVVSASFVTIENLELPYYIALLGAGALKICDWRDATAQEEDTDAEGAALLDKHELQHLSFGTDTRKN
ncbi:MAG: O-antigen ligase family protein [Pirellulaceae bacterium]